MKFKLIPEWKETWKFWSVRFNAAAVALLVYLVQSPTAIVDTWNMLPSDLKALIPVKYSIYIAIALVVLGIFVRPIKQDNIQK